MSTWVRDRRTDRIVTTLTGFEAEVLRSLAGQLVELLHNESALPSGTRDPLEELLDFSGPTTEPDDPVLARLFPSAYNDDDEAAAEFRRFTEGTLRDAKSAGASLIIDKLEEAGLPPILSQEGLIIDVELTTSEATSWLKSFTDLRLALASRLGIEEGDEDYWNTLEASFEQDGDDDEREGVDSELSHTLKVYDIYQWLGWLQESLVQALS